MQNAIAESAFKPTPSRHEAKSDTTTRVAREIIDGETAAQASKTERLRAARLAQEVVLADERLAAMQAKRTKR